MPYSEDAQPNEVRHARKGNVTIPAIRSSSSVAGPRPTLRHDHSRGTGVLRGRGRISHATSSNAVALGRRRWGAPSAGPSRSRDDYPQQVSFQGAGRQQARWRAGTQSQSVTIPTIKSTDANAGSSSAVNDEDLEPLLAIRHEPPNLCIRSYDEVLPDTEGAHHPIPPESNDIQSLPTPIEAPHSVSELRPPWNLHPQYPGLSISLARVFFSPPSVSPQTSTIRSSAAGMPATPKSPNGSPEPAPAESESSFDAPPSLTMETQRAGSPESREPAVSQDHSQFSCGDMWSNIPQAEVTDVNVPLASSARAVPDTPSHLSDATQEADSKRVSWGRWGALTRPPKFRSGTLMLSLPRRPQLGRRADARPISVPTDTEPSAASIQACVRTTSPADPVGLTSVEEQGPRTTRPKELSQTLQLRKDPYDKPRRLFVHRDMGIVNVSMRGCIDLIEGVNLRSVLEIRAGAMSNVNRQLVDDACVISDGENAIIALGHARSTQQLSLVQLQGKRARDIGTFDRPAQTERNGGISAVCAMMQPDMFATGGYDHFVHLWSISAGRPPTPSAPLALKHTSVVQSLLAIRDTSRKLITASADCSVNIFDLASERVVNTLRLSNSVYHVHPTVSQFCILLEVAHRELQFEMRDYRLVPTQPVVRFGYPSAKVHGRYIRGALKATVFASGGSEKDGCIRLWDLRKPCEVMQTISCLPGKKVIQVAFGNEQMVACSEDHYFAFISPIGDFTSQVHS